jgi:hypothetical protein
MRSMKDVYADKFVKISSDFDRYLISHPELDDAIPNKAVIIISVSDDEEFNKASYELAKSLRFRRPFVEAHRSGSSWSIRPFDKLLLKRIT